MSRRSPSLLCLSLSTSIVALLLTGCSFGLDFDDLVACGEHEQLEGEACVCAPSYVANELDDCVCPPHSAPGADGLCACEPPRVADAESGLCVCGPTWRTNAAGECVCPPGTVEQNNSCECPPDAPRDPGTGDCLCRIEDGLVWKPELGACGCARADHLLQADGACACASPLVESAPGSLDSSCVCPVVLGAEGGVFALSAEASVCTNELVRGGFLGRADRTPVDLTLLEISPESWVVALLEQDAANGYVSLYELTAASDATALTVVELGVARVPLVDDEEHLGIALAAVEGGPIPLVLSDIGPPRWLDLAQQTLEPLQLVEGAWPALLFNLGGTGWYSESTGRTHLLFYGLTWDTTVSEPRWVAWAVTPTGEPATGTLPVRASSVELDAAPFRNTVDTTTFGTILALNRPVRVLNSESTFLFGGLELTEALVCPDPCPYRAGAEPVAYELNLDPSSGELLIARRVDDGLDYTAFKDRLVELWHDYLGAGAAEDFFYFIGSIVGTGNEVRALALPAFLGCEIDGAYQTGEACRQYCVGGGCTRDGTLCEEDVDCSTISFYPVFEPAVTMSISRTAQSFETLDAAPIDDASSSLDDAWANKRVEAIDPSVLGVDPTRRLFLLTRQPFARLFEAAHELVLVEVEQNAFTPVMVFPFEGNITTVDLQGPALFTAGPFVFVQTNQGIRVLQLRALSAPVP